MDSAVVACLALFVGVPFAWWYINAWLHRQAAAAEQRMALLAVYTLNDPEEDLSNNVAPTTPATTPGYSARRDVDAEERQEYGYAAPLRLPNGGMLIHPAAVEATCVLYIPGFGRCFDHYRFDARFREQAGTALCGLDLRKYGRSYLAHKAGTSGRSCHFNLVERPREGLSMAKATLALSSPRGHPPFQKPGRLRGAAMRSQRAPRAPPGCRKRLQSHRKPGLSRPGLSEYHVDIDEACEALAMAGVRRVVLWGNSTGGLAVASYLAARAAAPLPPGMPELVAAVLDSPLLQFCRGKLPFPSWLEMPVALLLSRMPALIVQTDADLGAQPAAPNQPSWLDELATRRAPQHRYDRYLNPVRAKPTYAGYLSAVIIAMRAMARAFPQHGDCSGGGGAKLSVPTLLLLTARDVGMRGCKAFKPYGAPGVDQHIDTDAVEQLFGRIFARGTTLRRDDLLHEALMSDAPVVEQVLTSLAKLLPT